MDYIEQLDRAVEFARRAHQGQVRKYTHEPYAEHPIAVMGILQKYTWDLDTLIAAVLHDTVEDTNVTLREIEAEFGPTVATLVFWTTQISRPEDGNRETRKAIDRNHYSEGPPEAQNIKVADMIHNMESIRDHDPDFWVVYREEKRLLLDALTRADENLCAFARSIINVSY